MSSPTPVTAPPVAAGPAPVAATPTGDSAPEAPVTIPWWKYEFADFGCSTGGSLAHCLKRFDARSGVGIDIDPNKVEKTLAAGYDAELADLHQLDGAKSVRFVSMMQFLEHLPNLSEVERVVGKAASLATDFLYIHHPSFEDEHFLESCGLRLYYHHWTGHITHVLRDEFFEMFDRLGLRQYHVRPLLPIASSEHESILPTSAPVNQHQYDAEQHGKKPSVTFPRPVYQHMEIFVALRSFDADEWTAITAPR